MPYHIVKVASNPPRYKVEVHHKFLSKKPLTLNTAVKQRTAVILNELYPRRGSIIN